MNFTTLCKVVPVSRLARSKTVLIMKWTAVWILIGCMQVTASGTAQNVTLSVEDVSLKSVFREIKKQTGYSFFYNSRLLEKAPNVSVSAANLPLDEALKQILDGMPFAFNIVNKTVVISAAEIKDKPVFVPVADTLIEVKGVVVDASNNQPLQGASVLIKGSNTGTSTGTDGTFSLRVKSGTEIQVSYIGYEMAKFTARREGGTRVIKLKYGIAKDSMANVVVTGYQNIRKDNFTGTAITVAGEDLKMVNPQNILRSLQVFDPSIRIPDNTLFGSDPNRLPNITVRGSTALPSGNTDAISRSNLSGTVNLPTLILDGYEVSLQKVYDLDINRVESVSILKDAAATAIYGSRGANGVIVITTKAPKPGKLQVSYNYELNIMGPDLTQYDLLDASRKLEYERLAGVYDAMKNEAQSQQELDEIYYHKKALVVGGVNTYWLSQPLRTAFGNKHSLYLEGGDRSFRYGLEMRYQTMPGVMKGSGRDRISTGLSLSYNAGSKLLFRNVLLVTNTKANESPFGSFSAYAQMNPYYPKTDDDGKVVQVIDEWKDRKSAGGGIRTLTVLNPLYDAQLGSFNKSEYLEVIDAFSAEWNILPGLRARGLASINKTKSTSDRFVSPYANEFYFYAADELDKRGRYNYGSNDETSFDGNLTLTYNQQVGEHLFNAMLGTNVRTYLSRYREFEAIGFTNDRFTDIGFAAGYSENGKPRSHLVRERLVGSFATLNYAFRNKYLMDFTYRFDGSSKFGKDNKIAPFAAFGLGWNMHREEFMAGSIFSRFKLRASTGVTGSVSFDPYMSHPTYNYYTGNWYSTGIGAIVSSYGNSGLRWQKTQNLDFGLELGILNDRIVVMPRYYNKLTKGLLADISLPPSTGFDFYKENVGDMRNTGVELGLQASILRGKDYNLSVIANLVRNKNTIVKISNSLKNYNDKVDSVQSSPDFKGVPLLRYQEGQSLDAIYAVRSLGIDPENGRELYIDRNGLLTYDWSTKDIVVVGNRAPKGEGYFGVNGRYKQFTLNLNFYTRFGGETYNQTLVDRVENADPRWNVDSRVFEDKWKQRTDHTFFKNIADLGTSEVSSRFIQKDNVLELQSLFVSYDFKVEKLKTTPFKSLRAAFTMNDVWRWSSIKQERGIDYPYARSFTFSVTAGF